MSDGSEFQVCSRCVELQLRMPAVRIQFLFLQQTAARRRKIAEAEQEQLAGNSSISRFAPAVHNILTNYGRPM